MELEIHLMLETSTPCRLKEYIPIKKGMLKEIIQNLGVQIHQPAPYHPHLSGLPSHHAALATRYDATLLSSDMGQVKINTENFFKKGFEPTHLEACGRLRKLDVFIFADGSFEGQAKRGDDIGDSTGDESFTSVSIKSFGSGIP